MDTQELLGKMKLQKYIALDSNRPAILLCECDENRMGAILSRNMECVDEEIVLHDCSYIRFDKDSFMPIGIKRIGVIRQNIWKLHDLDWGRSIKNQSEVPYIIIDLTVNEYDQICYYAREHKAQELFYAFASRFGKEDGFYFNEEALISPKNYARISEFI